jgi:UDP-N-acetylmuramoyl-L-alanyl-D-glutamate--2,6-diaminopimelate ligase
VLLRDLLASAGGQLATAPIDRSAAGVDITAVTHDSRQVRRGAMFCCVRGARHDGHRFAGDAVRAGAAALLCEHHVATTAPEIVVPDTRLAMAEVAAAFHGHPSSALQVVGVTGTNGKTTTVHIVASILRAADVPTTAIGTLTGARTTPESTDLQALLADARVRGDRVVAMEVSSHALVQARVHATSFAAVAFTNLSRDHLDYHPSMEEYFKAKASLFTAKLSSIAVIDMDGPYGRLLAATSDVPRIIGTGISRVVVLDVGVAQCRFRWRDLDVRLPLGGRFNISNAVLAAELAVALGVEPDVVAAGLSQVPPVPGRFEGIDVGQPYTIVVDYAHTPDGLEQLLASAREIAGDGRVIVVFGCGGNRDVAKRPIMGRVAEEAADLVAVTSDNPRHEEPDRIIGDILGGMANRPWLAEADRRRAIVAALAVARPGDIVVIAGKGHETTQEIAGRVVHFDDREIAAAEATRLLGGRR